MEEHAITNKMFSYAFYALGAFVAILSVFSYSPTLVLIVSALLLLSAIYLNSGHILNNFLIRRSKLIEVYNGYRLSTDLCSAVKRVGKHFRGVSVAVFDIYKLGNVAGTDFASTLESISIPFEFGIAVREVSKKKLLDSLETKRRVKEIAITKADSKAYDKVNELNRELGVIESDIETIKRNGKPVEVALRIRTTSDAGTDIEASRESRKNLEQVANAFSATLSLDYTMLKGELLLDAIEAS